MAAKIHGLIYGFDSSIYIQTLLQELTVFNFEIHGVVDSKTLFNVVTKDGSTLEKRLQIDVWPIKESFSRGQLKQLSRVPISMNIADALTKSSTF